MELLIPYGKNENFNIRVPDKNVLTVIHPNKVKKQDETEMISQAIENPINSKKFKDFLSDAKDILLIVNDGTRPTPTARVLDAIHDQIKNKNVKFIVATGVHRAPTREEFDYIFGKYYTFYKELIFVHDCKKEDEMIYLGTTNKGTEIYLNRLGVKAHKIVIIGSVEPHYFAGYTGGRKAFLPGIASYQTIEQNHRLAMKQSAQTLVLSGNPVHEDMVDALKKIADKEIFSIQTVLDAERNLYAVVCGQIHDSFYKMIDKANEVFCRKIPEKADIVVSIVKSPMDIDLYQSHKALENGKLALKKGGILIMVSKCQSGIGESTFFDFLSSCKTPEDALKKTAQQYKFGYHKVAKIAEICTQAEIWGVSDLDDKEMEAVFIRPFHDLQEAIDKALVKKGRGAKIIFLMDGSITVPIVI